MSRKELCISPWTAFRNGLNSVSSYKGGLQYWPTPRLGLATPYHPSTLQRFFQRLTENLIDMWCHHQTSNQWCFKYRLLFFIYSWGELDKYWHERIFFIIFMTFFYCNEYSKIRKIWIKDLFYTSSLSLKHLNFQFI